HTPRSGPHPALGARAASAVKQTPAPSAVIEACVVAYVPVTCARSGGFPIADRGRWKTKVPFGPGWNSPGIAPMGSKLPSQNPYSYSTTVAGPGPGVVACTYHGGAPVCGPYGKNTLQ